MTGRSQRSVPTVTTSVRTASAWTSVRVTVTMLPNRKFERSPDVARRRLIEQYADSHMPTDQMMPMAESSRIRPRSLAHSIPSAGGRRRPSRPESD